METLICPKCGRKSDEIEFIDAFCTNCYPVSIKLPDPLFFDQCKRCSRVRFGNEWRETNTTELGRIVTGKCKGDFSKVHYDFEKEILTFSIIRLGKQLIITRSFPVTIKIQMCPQCSRISGGYYEGIMQLRGTERTVKKYAHMIEKRLRETSFISRVEEYRKGIDIYFGSTRAAIEVLGGLHVTYQITKKLFGMQEGKRVYRSTIVVRFEEAKKEEGTSGEEE